MGSPTLPLPNSMFRRNRSRDQDQEVPVKFSSNPSSSSSSNLGKGASTSSASKDSFANFRTFFRLASKQHVNSISSRRRRKAKNDARQQNVLGLRRSTSSTIITKSTTNRSSLFLDPLTMDDFLLAGELSAFQEETKEEVGEADESDYLSGTAKTHMGCTWKAIDEELEYAESQSSEAKQQQPLRSPESYFEMTKNENEELGNIQFQFESLKDAQKEALRRQRPILCIEAEVPGDIETGHTIFSHPLIVEAAECLFVTVQPRQLEPQDDEERFFRSSSCRTRVRILDDKGIDVIAPVEHMTIAQVVHALVRGLQSYRSRVPRYLTLLLEEEAGKLQALSKSRFREIQGEAIFGMFDSRLAEVEFAGLDGVLSTRSGALVRQQVVRVTYDSRRLSYGALVRHALRKTGTNVIYFETNDERIAAQLEVQYFHDYRKVQQRYALEVTEDSTPDIKVTEVYGNIRAIRGAKPALRDSILRFVPLTNLQSTRANRLIHFQKFDEAMHLLSPRQGLIVMQALRAHHSKHFQDVVDVPICSAWNELGMAEDCSSRSISRLMDKLHYVRGVDDESTESLTEYGEDPLPLIQ